MLTLGLIELVDNAVESEVKSSFEAIERSVTGVGACKAYVDGDAGLRIEKVEDTGRPKPPRGIDRGAVKSKNADITQASR